MNLIRPEVAEWLRRRGEVLSALAAAAAGLWLANLGGPVMAVLGLSVTAVALFLGVFAWRRMRFRMDVGAPGVASVDEGRITYLGPVTGGAVSLAELVEIEIIDVGGSRRCWRLRQADGQTLLVPLAAAGAESLFDHFATLPGMEMRRLMAALEGDAVVARRIWHRTAEPKSLPPA